MVNFNNIFDITKLYDDIEECLVNVSPCKIGDMEYDYVRDDYNKDICTKDISTLVLPMNFTNRVYNKWDVHAFNLYFDINLDTFDYKCSYEITDENISDEIKNQLNIDIPNFIAKVKINLKQYKKLVIDKKQFETLFNNFFKDKNIQIEFEEETIPRMGYDTDKYFIYYKVIIFDEVRPRLEVRINTNYLSFSYKCESKSMHFESITDLVINNDFDIDYDKTLHNFDNKLHTDFENFLNNYHKNDEIMLSTIELLKHVLK